MCCVYRGGRREGEEKGEQERAEWTVAVCDGGQGKRGWQVSVRPGSGIIGRALLLLGQLNSRRGLAAEWAWTGTPRQ